MHVFREGGLSKMMKADIIEEIQIKPKGDTNGYNDDKGAS